MKAGYPNMKIMIASNKGTPLRPGPIDAFLHSLSDENEFRLMFGAFQRHWAIYDADRNPKYKIDFSVVTQNSAQNGNKENRVLVNYLVNTLDFPKSKALAVSYRFHWVRSVEKPELVVHFFKSIGFTDAQIQSIVQSVPGILIADVEKTLKPKIQLFQELDITSSDLCKLMSSHANLLTRSLEKAIKPSMEVLNKVLINGTKNGDLFRVLHREHWSCWLSTIITLKNQPRLFALPESELKRRVSKLQDIGFSTNSRMFLHGLYTLGSITHETFLRKLKLFQSFGFSKYNCMEMFRKAPSLFRTSEEKIRLGLEFFLETMKLKKSTLVQHPALLMFSMKKRVIPRYQVLQLIKSKKLVKKVPCFPSVMYFPERLLLEKYVSRFTETKEELLMAYKGHSLDLGEE
ncbi:hypothetical protein RND71_010883 [Anisodus tanguticus]|uniref:Uncharacterized protein n=1 Tax=Anisodus tanguticus TaxID=243964 RepID=A0AAE1VII1_9SOLA|nr:hypothetical protein RND71_010883 [Anisodus tanguticus]